MFRLYVQSVLAPTLSPGDLTILDNLGSHEDKVARTAIRARGAHLILLPPYSPDLNPIEQVFAKLKPLMRRDQPRDVEATWRKAGQLLDLFSPSECANYLANSGYSSVLKESRSKDRHQCSGRRSNNRAENSGLMAQTPQAGRRLCRHIFPQRRVSGERPSGSGRIRSC